MRRLSDRQIDEVLDPNFLSGKVPGFDLAMEYSEVRRAQESEVSKFAKTEYGGWRHIGTVPHEVISALYHLYTPEELAADGGKLLIDFIRRHKGGYGSRPA